MALEAGGAPGAPAAGAAGPHGAATHAVLGAVEQDERREALERLRRFGGDRLVRDMARIFVTDMPARLERAFVALAARDASGAAYAAHTMKSSGAQFGLGALARLCGQVEQAARAADLAGVATLLTDVERELAAGRAWLERELQLDAGEQ